LAAKRFLFASFSISAFTNTSSTALCSYETGMSINKPIANDKKYREILLERRIRVCLMEAWDL
jgi:hypothetical protein